MQVHSWIPCSEVNGPGRRVVVWLQGCLLGCPGCWNPETHPLLAGQERTVDGLYSDLLAAWYSYSLEGITFSGGEPLHQLPELLALCSLLKPVGFSIGIYTGYTQAELDSGAFELVKERESSRDPEWKASQWSRLKSLLDFAVMGRYQWERPSDKPLLGSENQKLVLFSERYQLRDFLPQEVEVHVGDAGLVEITGFPGGKRT